MTEFKGVFPAIMAPQDDQGEILFDEMASLAKAQVGAGAGGFLVNGHTGEHMLLSGAERVEALTTVREAVGPDVPIVAGVHVQAARKFPGHAKSAAAAGADAVLIFSPFSFARGAFQYAPEVVVDFYRQAAAASPVPVFFMQYRPMTNLMMPRHVLVEVASLPNIAGIKQEVEDNIEYERDWQALKAAAPHVAVLTATERGLLGNYVVGADGCTIGLANFVAPVKAVQDAVWAGDLDRARAAAEDLRELADAVYRPPSFRWSSRLKYALHAAGLISTPHMRSPLFEATPEERKVIEAALSDMRVPA